MTTTAWATALLLLTALAWWLTTKALRVDRLHHQVLGARATVDTQLVHRAQAALDLVASGALDPASAALLAQAAHDALDCQAPVVDDGLDPAPPTPDGPQDGPAGDLPGQDRTRAQVESDLTRVLRAVVDEEARAAVEDDPLASRALRNLDRACSRARLARRIHDTHVSETLRIRSDWDTRLLHLAGHAPRPGTLDIDDDTTPHPRPTQEDQ